MTVHTNRKRIVLLHGRRTLFGAALGCSLWLGAGPAFAQEVPPPDPAAPPPAAPPPAAAEAPPPPVTTSAEAMPPPLPEPPPQVTPAVEESAAPRQVGGHVGIATPFVTFADETTTISDQFTLATPIGIGIEVSDRVVVDFETVVQNPVEPDGVTSLVVDPGVVYNAGVVALGLRLAFQINAQSNVGLIPLVNKGLVDLGGATWFIEAAFPVFYQNEDVNLTIVGHTGIGF